MIARSHITQIENLLSHFPVVALLGARQTGKTTLAKQLESDLGTKTIYLDLEMNSDLYKLESDPESFLDFHSDKLVILDEIQRKPELFALLRALIDKKRTPGRFLLLGSASPFLVKGVSETLAGRIAFHEIGGISLVEAHQAKITQDDLWLFGGYPESLNIRDHSIRETWHTSFIRTYIERDLSQLFNYQANGETLRLFFQMLAGSNGNLFNFESYARSLGITGPTVKKYLQYLTGAFLVNQIHPWSVNTRKRLVKSPKVFIRDSGTLHNLNHIQSASDLLGSIHRGASWEGFVIEQIRQHSNFDQLYFYRTHAGSEVDLVIVRGNIPIAAIEIKVSNAPKLSRGFHESISDLKTPNNFVIIPSGKSFPMGKNIWCYNLFDFITKELNRK